MRQDSSETWWWGMTGIGFPSARKWQVALVAVVVVIVAGVGMSVAAFAVDRAEANQILPGTTVAGVQVGGMTLQSATSAVRARVSPALRRGLTIRAANKMVRVLPANLGVQALVTPAVQKALQESQATGWLSRSLHRLFGWSANAAVGLRYDYPTAKITPLVSRLAASIDMKPQDASVAASANDMSIVRAPARTGRKLDQTRAVALVLGALRTQATIVRLPVLSLKPKVTEANLGTTITLDLTTNTLKLYRGLRLLRTYPVATATAPYSTPIGTWHVAAKDPHPVWINPGTAWAKSMPKEIGPGPGNPLGLRALALDAPGILIHGTPEDASIGHWASHGCIRMHEADAIALYPLVSVGARVIVFGAPPWGASTVAGAPPGF